MKIKNTSKADFNLKSGTLKPGDSAEATYEECQVLFSSNMAEAAVDKPAPKKAAPKKANPNG